MFPGGGMLDFSSVKWYDSMCYGELSERFKEPVLKTGDSERNLGFESLTLRQKEVHPKGVDFFLLKLGIRK